MTATVLWVAAVGGALLLGRWWGERRRRSRESLRLVARIRDLGREMRSTEDALQSVQTELERTKAIVSDAVLVLGPSLEVIAANDAARDAFDIHPEHRPALMSAIRSAELREVLDDDPGAPEGPRTIHVQDRVFTVRLTELPEQRRLLVLHDLTRMERLERARRDLVANVSHDLRTPLTAAHLLLDGLERDPSESLSTADEREGSNGDFTARLAGLRQQMATIEALAEGLVELNQLESGRALFRLAPERVRTLVDLALQPIDALLEEREIGVRLRLEPGLEVLADRAHAVRALRNVIDNAWRHSPRGGTVEIGARSIHGPGGTTKAPQPGEPGEVELWVVDQGPGIAHGDRSRVFERFYRGDPSRSSAGSGLGLAIAKHVIEGHGGRIWIDGSEREGARVALRLLGADPRS